ncbi:hypothetical protein NSZ01_24120 [Nocardioides szechwanensis]|jgi:hypothetical protein|uniref:Uncharacterized protein n=1 Tax=Nocardioides szechwanensis TaxID=1005944 RepID=A0A1H0EKT2_9ACTN|nr:hypothetical protein [Nocardioides szechwanensis]GEP34644.1 hypothetical protein NSZ01_24120 [Nocardioides szechwanensis]SDN82943.1 hypothetical protein SAMN05192576_2889 [Nocardioides szechwanensis]
MSDSSIFVKTELDYRSNRIRTSVKGNRHSRSRNPFVRRPADKSEIRG